MSSVRLTTEERNQLQGIVGRGKVAAAKRTRAQLLLKADAEHASLGGQRDLVIMQALIFGLLLVVCGNVGTLILARTA